MQPPLLGIIAGMEAEASALGAWRGHPRIEVAISAGRPNRASQEAERLVGLGVSALLSWGIAGGLTPELSPGDLLLADGVIEPGGRPFAFDKRLIAACGAALSGQAGDEPLEFTPAPPRRESTANLSLPPGTPALADLHLLAGSEIVVCRSAAKKALHHRTGAVAVDMETHRIAAIAREAGLPCLAIRAISDPASRNLPALVAHALDEEGRPRIGAVLRGLVFRPFDLPALIRAGRDSRKAFGALSSAAGYVVPALLAELDGRHPARRQPTGRDQHDR